MSHHSLLFIYQNRLIFESLSLLLAESLCYSIKGKRYQIKEEQWYDPFIQQFDVIIAEFSTITEDLFQFLNHTLKAVKDRQVLILAGSFEGNTVSNLLHAGVDGLLLTDCSSEDFLHAIEKLCSNDKYYCGRVMERMISNSKECHELLTNNLLSSRESEILVRIIQGSPNKIIADEFHVSESTIKTHRKNIMSKLEASNSITLLYNAFEANYLCEEDIPLCISCQKRKKYLLSDN